MRTISRSRRIIEELDVDIDVDGASLLHRADREPGLYRRLLVTNRTSPCPCLMDDEIERRHRALRGCARRVLLAGYCIVAASL